MILLVVGRLLDDLPPLSVQWGWEQCWRRIFGLLVQVEMLHFLQKYIQIHTYSLLYQTDSELHAYPPCHVGICMYSHQPMCYDGVL